MRYLSVCSGIDAATVAWHPLGWQAVAYSEIDPFASAVLASHYPDVPNVGDMERYCEWQFSSTVDLLVGGTPCQSFSIAGLRGGLADPRGNLALVYLGLVEHFSPRWVVWENVPGVLSADRGRAFGSFLGGLAQLGYGWAYAIRDAQFYGVAQRRRRVFVIGYLGDWRRAAAVLLESESCDGDSAPRRETGTRTAALTANVVGTCGADDNQAQAGHLVADTLRSHPRPGSNTDGAVAVVPTLTARYGKGTDPDATDGMVIGFHMTQDPIHGDEFSPALGAKSTGMGVAFSENQRAEVVETDIAHQLTTGGGKPGQGYPAVREGLAVRRLTPLECERLQGFPAGWTQSLKDGARYRTLGNAVAVPVAEFIGNRIMEFA